MNELPQKKIPNHKLLMVWQLIVISGTLLISLLPLFSALWNNDSSLLYKAVPYLLTAVVMGFILLFFSQKKMWAVVGVAIEAVLVVGLILYRFSIDFNFLSSNDSKSSIPIQTLIIIILFGLFSLYILWESIRYIKFLKE